MRGAYTTILRDGKKNKNRSNNTVDTAYDIDRSDPIRIVLIRSDPTRSDHIGPDPTTADVTRFRPDACPIRTDSIRSDPIGTDPALSLSISLSLLALGRFLFVAVFVCFGGMRVRSERRQKRAEGR